MNGGLPPICDVLLGLNDHHLIWDALDKVHGKHPGMVVLHGGSPKGAERIAARWADHRKAPQIAFKPDWIRHPKPAPFKRNDQMRDVLPIGVMVFPGAGIQGSLADKAKKLGIPDWKFGNGGGKGRPAPPPAPAPVKVSANQIDPCPAGGSSKRSSAGNRTPT